MAWKFILLYLIVLCNAQPQLTDNDSDHDGIPDYNNGEGCGEPPCEGPEFPPPEFCDGPCPPTPEPSLQPTLTGYTHPPTTTFPQIDNCIGIANPNQADYDKDGFGNVCDNCPFIYNPDQLDTNSDGIGDACQNITYGIDSDGDGIPDILDNCVNVSNPAQHDTDNDTIGNSCDNNIDGDYYNNYYDDNDDDLPSNGEWAPYDSLDVDDNCPLIYNYYQTDNDNDGVGDFVYDPYTGYVTGCDNCYNLSNPNQTDTDGDGWGDPCDNCPFVSNPDQKDDDNDGIGNACTPSPTQSPTKYPTLLPSINPSISPSKYPTITPTQSPTEYPTTVSPTKYPTLLPSINPSISPSKYPTINPSITPSISPTNQPSITPSITPSKSPTKYPTTNPSYYPSKYPTKSPTEIPSNNPSNIPTKTPTENPTKYPSKSPSNQPSITPTKYPSKNPTKYPSENPTKYPSENPTKYPSKSPTKYPSENPSNSPTKYPSKSPTKTPSINPTNTPITSLNPTKQPSLIPTNIPSISPTKYTYYPTKSPTDKPSTKSPTKQPSLIPTNIPSISPTYSPSTSPTEAPIDDGRNFDYNFIIKYVIKKLEIKYIEILVNNILHIIDDIINLIEESYFECTGVQNKFFKLEIEQMLGFEIKDINKDKEPHFLHGRKEIFVDSNIKCVGKKKCELLANSDEFKEKFELIATNKLRAYFTQYLYNINAGNDLKESKLEFAIAGHGSLELLYPNPSETRNIYEILFDHLVLVILLCVLFIIFIICIFAYVYSKYAMNDSIWYAVIIYGLQCAVMVCDINLCVELLSHNNFISDIRITLCGIFCVIFILIPYGTNLYFGGKITQLIPRQNTYAILFFKEKHIHDMFIILLIISGGCYPVLCLLSSGIFGIKVFDSGLTDFELKQMNKIKIISTICLQNIVQIIIQCVYIACIHTMTINTRFAMIMSILSIIITPFHLNNCKNYWSRNNVFKYYIELEEINNDMDTNNSDEWHGEINDIHHFKENKDKITQIENILSEAFGYTHKYIDISRNISIEPNGLSFYIVHYGNNYENINKVIKLYKDTEKFLKSEFKQYFGLYGECKIIFKSIDGSFSITIDDDENNTLQTDYNNSVITNCGEQKETFINQLYDAVTTNNGGKNDEGFNTIELQPIVKHIEEKEFYDEIVLNEEQQQIMKEIIVDYNNSDAGSESDFDFAV